MTPRAALASIARDGLVVRRDVAAAGVPLSSFDRWVREGELRRWDHEVYGAATLPRTHDRQVLAAVLACGEAAVASHLTAGALHGLHQVRRPATIHVTTPYDELRRPASGIAHRSRHLEEADVAVLGAVPITSVARTICDIAPHVSAAHLETIVMDAIRRGLTTADDLDAMVDRLGRTRAGSRKLRRLLTSLHPETTRLRSVLEVVALPIIIGTGLDGLRIGYTISDAAGNAIAELDFAFPDVRLAIEIDGLRWHATRQDKERDDRRQNWLVAQGWTVLRFSLGDLRDRPWWVVQQITTVHARLAARA